MFVNFIKQHNSGFSILNSSGEDSVHFLHAINLFNEIIHT